MNISSRLTSLTRYTSNSIINPLFMFGYGAVIYDIIIFLAIFTPPHPTPVIKYYHSIWPLPPSQKTKQKMTSDGITLYFRSVFFFCSCAQQVFSHIYTFHKLLSFDLTIPPSPPPSVINCHHSIRPPHPLKWWHHIWQLL